MGVPWKERASLGASWEKLLTAREKVKDHITIVDVADCTWDQMDIRPGLDETRPAKLGLQQTWRPCCDAKQRRRLSLDFFCLLAGQLLQARAKGRTADTRLGASNVIPGPLQFQHRKSACPKVRRPQHPRAHGRWCTDGRSLVACAGVNWLQRDICLAPPGFTARNEAVFFHARTKEKTKKIKKIQTNN